MNPEEIQPEEIGHIENGRVQMNPIGGTNKQEVSLIPPEKIKELALELVGQFPLEVEKMAENLVQTLADIVEPQYSAKAEELANELERITQEKDIQASTFSQQEQHTRKQSENQKMSELKEKDIEIEKLKKDLEGEKQRVGELYSLVKEALEDE
jgi:predicted RNase H-like nuclease (RuvC/YqgF family)